jgi:hypothetical protein
LTTRIWNSFREGYEIDIANYSGTCINSTEGGAFIKGTSVMPLQESIDKYIKDEFYPVDLIKKYLSEFTKENVDRDVENVMSIIDKTTEDVRFMMEECMQGLKEIQENEEYLSSVLNNEASIEARDIIDKILKHKNNVMLTSPTMELFLMHIVQSFHIKFEMDMFSAYERYDNEEKNMAYIAIQHKKWYAVIYDIMQICIDSLEKAKRKIEDISNYK